VINGSGCLQESKSVREEIRVRQGEEEERTDDIADTHESKVIQVQNLLLLHKSQYHQRHPSGLGLDAL
jgi:hypothetical protein